VTCQALHCGCFQIHRSRAGDEQTDREIGERGSRRDRMDATVGGRRRNADAESQRWVKVGREMERGIVG
jgi:hypothetical protein